MKRFAKRYKIQGLPSILSLFSTSLINSIIPEHECWILNDLTIVFGILFIMQYNLICKPQVVYRF